MSDSRDHPALRYDENWPQQPVSITVQHPDGSIQVVGAVGSSDSVPMAPGANGPTGVSFVAAQARMQAQQESLYEPCIATQGPSAEIPVTEEMIAAAGPGVSVQHYALKQHELNRMTVDRDAWSARCAALMTKLDAMKERAGDAEGLAAMYKRDADLFHGYIAVFSRRAAAAETRLAERDASLHRAMGRR